MCNGSVLMSDAKVHTINQHYVYVFSKEVEDMPSNGVSPHPVMENLSSSWVGVTKLLKGLNKNKASGSDGSDKISSKVINELAEVLSPTSPPYSPHP